MRWSRPPQRQGVSYSVGLWQSGEHDPRLLPPCPLRAHPFGAPPPAAASPQWQSPRGGQRVFGLRTL